MIHFSRFIGYGARVRLRTFPVHCNIITAARSTSEIVTWHQNLLFFKSCECEPCEFRGVSKKPIHQVMFLFAYFFENQKQRC